jgi:hypothetical protein
MPLKERGFRSPLPLPRFMLGVSTHLRRWKVPAESAYDGPQIVGMDLHRRRSVLVRMTPEGQRLATARIDNAPDKLAAEIAKAGRVPKVVLEATYALPGIGGQSP